VLVTHDVDEALRVADRIALMNVGGVIEQLATPDELMRAPANDFVKSFVGEDRGLRRLALNTVAALRFHQGPVVDHEASDDDAELAIATEGSDWLGITIAGRFVGWTRVDDVRAARQIGRPLTDVERFDPIAQITPTSTLRAAMELIMSSNSSVAVINDAGNFGGVVTLEDIRRALSSDAIEAADGTV
jgi:osmoprotectant transport system ATP-binding protein